MRGKNGQYHFCKHRIFYFSGSGRQGISYALCLYNVACEGSELAYLINTLTGERKLLVVDGERILTNRKKVVLQIIRDGKSSKMISEKLETSKHTVDRHRQNIIAKLHSHLFHGDGEISFGIYAASPVNHSFTAKFTNMEVGECKWAAWSAADTGFNQTHK